MNKIKLFLVSIFALIMQAVIAFADTFQWTGAQDAYWTNAANWTVEGAVAVRCPGVVTTTGSTADYTALHKDTDEAVFSGAFTRNTINLDGLFSIHAITITGSDTPQVVFGANDGQVLPMAWKGSFTIESSALHAPVFVGGILLGKGNKGQETGVVFTFTQDSFDPVHFTKVCGDSKDDSWGKWVSSPIVFKGKGDLYFDCKTSFVGTFDPNFYTTGTVYINSSLNKVRSFKIREESSGRFVLGDEGCIPFSSGDKPGIYVYRSGVTTFEGGVISFASGHVKVCDAYTLSWGCLSGGIVQFKNCQLKSQNGSSVTPNFGMTVGVNNAMGEDSNTGTFEFLNDNKNVTGPLEIVDGLTIKTAKIGASGDVSPIGSGSEIWFARDGKLAYTGAGETMSRSLVITNYRSSAAGTLSQQGSGEWRITSPISVFSDNDATLTLHNAGEVEAILSSSVPDPIVSGPTTGKTDFKKTGIGTWVIDEANTFSGNVILEDGTLRLTPKGDLGHASCLITRGGTLKIEANAPRTVAFETVRFQGGLRLEFDPALVTVKMMSHAGREPLFLTVNGEEALVEADGTVRAKKPHEYAYDPTKWGQYPERWFYWGKDLNDQNLSEDARLKRYQDCTNLCVEARNLGYTAISPRILEDILYGTSYESRKYVCQLVECCDNIGLDIIPMVWNAGWDGKLNENAVEGEYITNVAFVVTGGQAVVDSSEHPTVLNSSFEEGKANWSIPGVASIDSSVARTGANSLHYKLSKSNTYNTASLVDIDVKKDHRYSICGWFYATKETPGIQLENMTNNGSGSSFSHQSSQAFTHPGDGVWRQFAIQYTPSRDRQIQIRVGTYNKKVQADAEFWVDDVAVVDLTHRRAAVRREGVEFKVVNASSGFVYEEGVDYETIKGVTSVPHNYNITSETPELKLILTPNSRLQEGDNLLVSYSPHIWRDDGYDTFVYCMSNPKLHQEVRNSADWIYRRLNPRKWFLYIDEIRGGGSCQNCIEHYPDLNDRMARILSDYIKNAYNHIRKNQPRAEIITWDDMISPHHNAVEKYRNCVGSFVGVWNMIPKDIIILDWLHGEVAEGNDKLRVNEEFLRETGFRTVAGGYYDTGSPIQQSINYAGIMNNIPGQLGYMYCTWQTPDYSHMGECLETLEAYSAPSFLTNEWVGASSGAWSNAANWLPAMETRAVVHIPAGVTVTVEESDLIMLNKMREIIVDGTLVLNTSEAPATTITGAGIVRKMSNVTWEALPTTMDGFDGYVLVANGTIEMRDTSEQKGPIIYKPDIAANKPVISYGQQYLQTPLRATGAVAGEFSVAWNDISKEQCLAGVASDAGLVVLAGIRQGHWVYAMSTDGSFIDTGIEVEAGRRYQVKVILEPGRQEFWLDNVCVSRSELPDTISFDAPFYLFALNQNGIAVQKASVSVTSAKLYEKTAEK